MDLGALAHMLDIWCNMGSLEQRHQRNATTTLTPSLAGAGEDIFGSTTSLESRNPEAIRTWLIRSHLTWVSADADNAQLALVIECFRP